jgi:spore coat polysaccharide biosynthesis predicted glycosyltransferase SpsG
MNLEERLQQLAEIASELGVSDVVLGKSKEYNAIKDALVSKYKVILTENKERLRLDNLIFDSYRISGVTIHFTV